MGAYGKRVRLRLYQPPTQDHGWPAVAILGLVALAVAAVFGMLWLAARIDRDSRRRENEKELRELDDRMERLRAIKERARTR